MNTLQVIFNGQFRIVCIFNAIENIHIYEPSKDWDEEVEEDKEKVDTLNKEEDICQNNKEDSEEKCPLVEETLVYWKNEEENFPKDEDEKYPEDENMSKVEEEYSNKEEDMEASKVFNYKQRWGKTKLKYFLGIMIHWMVNILLLCPILITGKI